MYVTNFIKAGHQFHNWLIGQLVLINESMELWEIPLRKKIWSVIIHAKQAKLACLIFFHTFYQMAYFFPSR